MVIGVVSLLFQREPLRFPPLLLWYGLLMVWCAVSWSHSPFPDVSWETLTLAAKLWLILLVAVNALRRRIQVLGFAAFFLGCFLIYPVRGALTNLFLVGYSLDGRAIWNQAFSNPNDLAGVAVLQLSMALGLVAMGRSVRRWWVGLVVGILAVLILLTQSRGAFVALCVFTLLALGLQRRRLAGLSMVLGVAGILAVTIPSSIWARMAGLRDVTSVATLDEADSEGSARQRFEIWRVASTIAMEHPVFGVGIGAYMFEHGIVANRPEFDPIAAGNRDAHSTYLTAAAETGFPGLLLFLLLVGTTLWRAARVATRSPTPWIRAMLSYLILGYIAYLVAAIWGSYNQLVYGFVHLALLSSVTEIARETSSPAVQFRGEQRRGVRSIGVARYRIGRAFVRS